jgi:hypothetical protein
MSEINSLSKNVSFLHKIDTTVKNIMKDGKIDHFDIPEIMFLITDLITSSENTKITMEQLQNSIQSLYEYIMTHYNLFPEDAQQKESFKRLFDTCLKLIMFQPKVKEVCKRVFPCLS